MTLPPQGHPQYELKRRIADCRERLRRTRTGHKGAERDADASRANDAPTADDEADEAPAQAPRQPARRDVRR